MDLLSQLSDLSEEWKVSLQVHQEVGMKSKKEFRFDNIHVFKLLVFYKVYGYSNFNLIVENKGLCFSNRAQNEILYKKSHLN